MYPRLIIALATVMLAACVSTPQVYAPSDEVDKPPTGEFLGMSKVLAGDTQPLRLVFVHGVGDHCPGYALDWQDGWLSKRVAEAVGLMPQGLATAPVHIPPSVFLPAGAGPSADDPRSFVAYSTRRFRLRTSRGEREVEAVEITWSPLTQWLKSNQLGYDSSSTTPAPGKQNRGCLEPPDDSVADIKPPPNRLLLDKLIKERIFNRNLSDAILYGGPYGTLIQRGVAEAMCRAFTGHAGSDACPWSALSAGHTHIFFTHSLGSRIIYDTLLGLVGYHGAGQREAFSDAEWRAARPAIRTVLADTPAFYLMANQLSLLGLANVPVNAQPTDGPRPYVVPVPLALQRAAPAGSDPDFTSRCDTVLEAFGEASSIARRVLKKHAADSTMQIVAFNDTNDLLTWHVPSWYANSDPDPNCRPAIDVVNVFVQNAAKLLILENPATAHSGYFRNRHVWQAVACGAEEGRLLDCLP